MNSTHKLSSYRDVELLGKDMIVFFVENNISILEEGVVNKYYRNRMERIKNNKSKENKIGSGRQK